jgi:hypothetical protein
MWRRGEAFNLVPFHHLVGRLVEGDEPGGVGGDNFAQNAGGCADLLLAAFVGNQAG